MKGKNPIIVILAAFLLIAGLLALVISGKEDEELVLTGQGAEAIKNAAPSQAALDEDKLPQEFTKLMVDMRDMQATLGEMNKTMEGLQAENAQLEQQALQAQQQAQEAQKKALEGQDLLANLEKPDPAIYPIPPEVKQTQSAPLLQELGQFMTPIAPLKNAVDSVAVTKTGPVVPMQPASGVVWIEPMDASYSTSKTAQSKTATGLTPSNGPLSAELQSQSGQPGLLDELSSKTLRSAGLETGVSPRFTVPNGSVITDSLSVTALVGRIPVSGKVTDPWRFKISTGRTIVMPNDHELQGLEKTIVQGDAIGDLNLRCVSGRIDTITFVFNDGRIVTHQAKNQGSGGSSARPGDYLGYISDQYANPCIPGELITNAPQAIAQIGLLGAAEGIARGVAEAEVQTSTTAEGSVVRNVVGDQMKFAGYQGLADGVGDVRAWFAQRMGQYFDVIYAKAGQTVDIHIEQEIKIDYDPMGRKVRYETAQSDDRGYMD